MKKYNMLVIKAFIFIVLSFVCMSCTKQVKNETDTKKDQELNVIINVSQELIEDNNGIIDNEQKVVNLITIDDFNPRDFGSLFPVDFERLGLKEMVSLSEVLEKISEKIVLNTSKIHINMSTVKSFLGIEQFINLQSLELYNLEIDDLTEISLNDKIEWLSMNDSVINNMNGLQDLQKLYFLSLRGSKIINLEELEMPNSLGALVLSNFPQYREVISKMSDSVEQLYLEDNNITSLSEIEYLQKIPNLRVLYIRNNKIPQDELIKNTPFWGDIELIWFLS